MAEFQGISGSYNLGTNYSDITAVVQYSEKYYTEQNYSQLNVKLILRNNGESITPLSVGSIVYNGYINYGGTFNTVDTHVINSSSGLSVPLLATGQNVVVFDWTSNKIQHTSAKEWDLRIESTIHRGIFARDIKLQTNSQQITLSPIPQPSIFSVTSNELTAQQTITITSENESYKHTVSYSCGSLTGVIADLTADNEVQFTLPISIASQFPTSSNLYITYVVETYSPDGNTLYGSRIKSVYVFISQSVKPAVSLAYEDATSYASTYGGLVQGYSKLRITLTATAPDGCSITEKSATANKEVFTDSSGIYVTDVIKWTQAQEITAYATDSRGRTSYASTTFNALAYTPPTINALIAQRCNADGTDNILGTSIKVIFSGSVKRLNNNNTTKWVLNITKNADNSDVDYVVYNTSKGNYSVENTVVVINNADTGSTYDCKLTVTDDFSSVSRTAIAPTAAVIMHFAKNGEAMAIGKVIEPNERDLVDFGWKARFFGGLRYTEIPNNTDLNTLITPNFYCGSTDGNYINGPTDLSGNFRLEVQQAGSNVLQIITVGDAEVTTYMRISGISGFSAWAKKSLLTQGAYIVRTSNYQNNYPGANVLTELRLNFTASSNNSDAVFLPTVHGFKTQIKGLILLAGTIRIGTAPAGASATMTEFTGQLCVNGISVAEAHLVMPYANIEISLNISPVIINVNVGDELTLKGMGSAGNVRIVNSGSSITALYV